MSVSIRLSKSGRTNSPAYKIVVTNTRDKREGKFLDILGYYNPSVTPLDFSIDKNKLQEWVKKGAIVSKAVSEVEKGTYKFKPYKSKNKGDSTGNNSEKETQQTENTESNEETEE